MQDRCLTRVPMQTAGLRYSAQRAKGSVSSSSQREQTCATSVQYSPSTKAMFCRHGPLWSGSTGTTAGAVPGTDAAADASACVDDMGAARANASAVAEVRAGEPRLGLADT